MTTAAANAAGLRSGEARSLPLARRPGDAAFAVVFALFAFTSFFSDLLGGLNLLGSDGFWARSNRWYGERCDPYFLSNPINVQAQTFLSAFVFGPFYLVLIYALVRGRNWIRMPAIVYASAMTYGMILYFGTQFLGPLPPTNLPMFLGFNLPYLIVPLALAYRMRKPRPFGA